VLIHSTNQIARRAAPGTADQPTARQSRTTARVGRRRRCSVSQRCRDLAAYRYLAAAGLSSPQRSTNESLSVRLPLASVPIGGTGGGDGETRSPSLHLQARVDGLPDRVLHGLHRIWQVRRRDAVLRRLSGDRDRGRCRHRPQVLDLGQQPAPGRLTSTSAAIACDAASGMPSVTWVACDTIVSSPIPG
jgi:hypothetical protein